MSTPAAVATISREEFLAKRFRYRAGEHLTVVGPTGCGKSHLVFELLAKSATPSLPAIYLVKKPRDRLIEKAGKALGFRRISRWPAPPSLWKPRKPPGYLLWPRTTFVPEKDRTHKGMVFEKALLDSYEKGDRIAVADDAYGISEILGLRQTLIEMWTEARSMDTALWAMFQKPSHVPLWAYSQAEHLFLFNDPDKRARERFAEIGGLDPDLIKDTVLSLKKHQCVYIRRDGPRMCVVDK